MDEAKLVRVASVEDIPEGECLAVEVGDEQIALFNLGGGEICATHNICTHEYACLSEGWLEDGIVECPLHEGRFDVRTGKGQGAPITLDLPTYPVSVEGDDVYIRLP
jgi:nitrite reductase/ring-hydroxylating ferredoxin subunit